MLLIDGDVVKYRAAWGAERSQHAVTYYNAEFDEQIVLLCDDKREAKELIASALMEPFDAKIETTIIYEPVEHATRNVESIIEGIMKATSHSPDETLICLSGGTNFRDDVATIRPYKGNRDDKRKPTHGDACVQYMLDNYKCRVSENEEADDLMGYLQMEIYRDNSMGSVIATIDKDLDMIPGMHYNFVKEESYLVSEEEADKNFWRQMIIGDTTDNITGVPKKGPKAAAQAEEDGLLNHEGVLSYYVTAYGEEEGSKAFIENGQLLWIRRNKEELWPNVGT